MKFLSLFLASMTLAIFGCNKDEPSPDLSYLCDKGGIWLVDRKDSFNPNSRIDTCLFDQRGGYHRFIFTNSVVNKLQIDVLTKPDSGMSRTYKKEFIREISGSYMFENFTYSNMKDSMLTIENKGQFFLVSLKPVQANIGTKRTIELRACNLRMNDVTP